MMSISDIKKNNKGSALIVSIIVLLFVSILATVLLYMSGINYRVKINDYKSKVSFYSGEEPLERMQSNLFIPISVTFNNAYRTTNTIYGTFTSSDDRRLEFYSQFAENFKDLMLDEYGNGKGLGSSAVAEGHNEHAYNKDKTAIHYIIYNLTLGDNSRSDYTSDSTRGVYIVPEEVDINDIYVNYSGVVYPSVESYINTLDSLPDRGDGQRFFDNNTSDPNIPRVYICLSSQFNSSETDEENYNKLIRLSVTDDPDDDPLYPTSSLNDPDKCRLLIKNVGVVIVQNDFKTYITTDIAIQMPPLDWGGGGSNPDYRAYNPSNGLIYYVNWQKS